MIERRLQFMHLSIILRHNVLHTLRFMQRIKDTKLYKIIVMMK